MAEFYTASQRQLQDEFDSRALADRLEAAIVTSELSAEQAAFIHERELFFLSTIDEAGFPTVSYKGGAAGFVRSPENNQLIFPSYDGNGMFMSAGNIAATQHVGLLFIDFEKPQRLRVRGRAKLLRDGPFLESYPGAQLAVDVTVDRVWQNCPRYVHRMSAPAQSPNVPGEDGKVRFALWKRIDVMQDVLNEADRATAASLGIISAQEYEARLSRGEAD